MTRDVSTLRMLAFDHRADFERLFGVAGRRPTPDEARRIREGKELILDGFRTAVDDGVDGDSAAILVDPEYGVDVARRAADAGVRVAISVERPGPGEFDFEFGDRFGEHLLAQPVTCAKAMVLYNPEGDTACNTRQATRLRRLGDWLRRHRREFLLELLVPAEPGQLASVGGAAERYASELRPELVARSVVELQDAGLEPDVWKLQGMRSPDACRQVVAAVRRDGRDAARCVVLGAGAGDAEVDAWLVTAASIPGYVGFAIGRSIFAEAVEDWAAGRISREDAVTSVARRFRRFVAVDEGAR